MRLNGTRLIGVSLIGMSLNGFGGFVCWTFVRCLWGVCLAVCCIGGRKDCLFCHMLAFTSNARLLFIFHPPQSRAITAKCPRDNMFKTSFFFAYTEREKAILTLWFLSSAEKAPDWKHLEKKVVKRSVTRPEIGTRPEYQHCVLFDRTASKGTVQLDVICRLQLFCSSQFTVLIVRTKL
jgi:hypothetical protein